MAEFAGQGYMTAALELVVRDAFARLRLHRLEAKRAVEAVLVYRHAVGDLGAS